MSVASIDSGEELRRENLTMAIVQSAEFSGMSAVEGEWNARYIWTISTVAAMGGLLFGYDWVVIGGAKVFYEAYFHLASAQEIGWANSCALIGCLFGSLIAGALSDRYGRKKLLVTAAILFAISSALTGMAGTFAQFIGWRMLGGVAIGIASNVSPTYIAEISPSHWRGRLVSLNQMTIVVGILLAQIMNWAIARPVAAAATQQAIEDSWNGQWAWRWMFIAVVAPSLLFLVSALCVPESPRWLVVQARRVEALRILSRIGGASYAVNLIEEMEGATDAEPKSKPTWKDLTARRARPMLVIGIVLAVLQQWTGINIIFNYAEEIYRTAGYGVSGTMFNIVITGAISFVSTLMALQFVDRVGRRPLMLCGCASVGVSQLLIGFAYRAGMTGFPVLLLTLFAIGFYSMTLAPVTWVILSEISPNRIRGRAMAVSVSALWIASFFLTYSFPFIQKMAGAAGTFWLYGVVCLAGFLFIFMRVPETKRKTLEEIETEFSPVSYS